MFRDDEFLVGFGFLLGCCLFAGSCGYTTGQSAEREKASRAGVGRFVVDPKTGAKSFSYGTK